MNRYARFFAIFVVSTLTATGCFNGADGDEEDFDEQTADLKSQILGADTNGSTLDIGFARSRGCKFIGRYLSFDGEHPALTREETERFRAARMKLIAIWETGQQRAIETGSIQGQYAAGVADAQKANARLNAVGVHNKPIYFTVDYNVTPKEWSAKVKDKRTGKQIQKRQLILAYFNGINSVIGAHRTGAYGTFTTIHELFDAKKIGYGWQQTFASRGDKVDKRAQLRQYNIYADQTGWGVSGAGALDLDLAVKGDYGQF